MDMLPLPMNKSLGMTRRQRRWYVSNSFEPPVDPGPTEQLADQAFLFFKVYLWKPNNTLHFGRSSQAGRRASPPAHYRRQGHTHTSHRVYVRCGCLDDHHRRVCLLHLRPGWLK